MWRSFFSRSYPTRLLAASCQHDGADRPRARLGACLPQCAAGQARLRIRYLGAYRARSDLYRQYAHDWAAAAEPRWSASLSFAAGAISIWRLAAERRIKGTGSARLPSFQGMTNSHHSPAVSLSPKVPSSPNAIRTGSCRSAAGHQYIVSFQLSLASIGYSDLLAVVISGRCAGR